MNIEDLSDDIELAVEPKADRTAVAIRDNLSRVETALAEFDRVSAGLADLAARYPHDLVYDVTTTKGMQEAIAHRAAWREPRIQVEKYRKTAKAPVLALGKDIDARAAWLTEQLLEGETPVDEQIKAEERRKDAIRQARINAEFARVAAIQEAIAEIHMDVMAVAGKPSDVISAKLAELRECTLSPAVFQEQLDQAKAAQRTAIEKLEIALKAALFSEAESAKLAAERAELAELRRAAAEQKAKEAALAAEAAATAKVERDRIAAEQQAERDRLAAERAEMERVQRNAAAVIAAQQAELARQMTVLEESRAAKPIAISEPLPAAPKVDAPADDSPPITTGAICDRLGFMLTPQFLKRIGFEPVYIQRPGTYWRESDWPWIKAALIAHIGALA